MIEISVVRHKVMQEDKRTGKVKFLRITVRKMLLHLADAIGPKYWRIVLVSRKGETKYCLSYVPEPKKEKWNTLKLNTVIPDIKYKKEASLNRVAMLDWLRWCIQRPEFYLVELETRPAEEKEAA